MVISNVRQQNAFSILLLVILLLTFIVSVCFGAVSVSVEEIVSAIIHSAGDIDPMSLNERIIWTIRIPRAIMCILVGASLAVGGTLMQGLFRNPIVEPGLIGASSGAAFGAALYFTLGALFKFNTGEWTLPLSATAGSVLSSAMLFGFSASGINGRSSVVTMLLVGVAVNALFLSGVGFLSFIARDPQARSITFWSMGTLSGANWKITGIVSLATVACSLIAMMYAKQLNALVMGEQDARYIGININRLKWGVILTNIVLIATTTAFVGVISFVGLIVPHLVRIVAGSDNKYLIRHSFLAGGIFLSWADVAARLLVCPAELPIGIVTSLIGVPVFIWLLRKNSYQF